MKKLIADNKFNILYSVAAVLFMWAVWLIAGATVKNEYLVPPFGESARQFFALFANGFFWLSLLNTFLRTLIAFALSFVSALACALLSSVFKGFASFMRPITAVFRALPTMAVLLLIMVWLTPRTAPVPVAMLVLFPMIYSQLTDAIAEVDGGLIEMAKVYKLPRATQIKSIYIPHVAPIALAQTGANLSFGIKLIISAEVMAATYTAIGGMMAEAQAYINLPRLAALTVCALLFGMAVELAFRALSKLVTARRGGV